MKQNLTKILITTGKIMLSIIGGCFCGAIGVLIGFILSLIIALPCAVFGIDFGFLDKITPIVCQIAFIIAWIVGGILIYTELGK